MRHLIAEMLLKLGTRLVRAALERLGYGYVVVKSAAYEAAEQKARAELEERMRWHREVFDRFMHSAVQHDRKWDLRTPHERELDRAINTITRLKTWN